VKIFCPSPKHPAVGRRHVAIAGVAALIVGNWCAQAAAAEKLIRSPDGDTVQIDAPKGPQQRIAANAGHPFATARQRAAVKPMIWNEADNIQAVKPDAAGTSADVGKTPEETRAPSASPAGAAPSYGEYMARNQFPNAWKAIDAERLRGDVVRPEDGKLTTRDGAHYPFYRFAGNYYTSQWLVPPWNKIGKLYFNTPGGGGSYCTASVASGTSVIVTAAHCVYSRGLGWNSNFVFVPADRYGAAPYGSYGWQSATVLNDWINIGGRRHDVAVIKLAGEASSGQPVTNYVGWLGRSWDWGYEQWTYSHGYASNFSTQYTNVCAGWTFYSPTEGNDVLVQGCDMTYGSSGGPWLREFTHNSHGGNYVNAVVSGPHVGAFGTYYVGPRFSSANIVPLCNAIGC
jgi:V8-like Glu-specific endopeptidase